MHRPNVRAIGLQYIGAAIAPKFHSDAFYFSLQNSFDRAAVKSTSEKGSYMYKTAQ